MYVYWITKYSEWPTLLWKHNHHVRWKKDCLLELAAVATSDAPMKYDGIDGRYSDPPAPFNINIDKSNVVSCSHYAKIHCCTRVCRTSTLDPQMMRYGGGWLMETQHTTQQGHSMMEHSQNSLRITFWHRIRTRRVPLTPFGWESWTRRPKGHCFTSPPLFVLFSTSFDYLNTSIAY